MQLSYDEMFELLEIVYENAKNDAFDEQFENFIEQKKKCSMSFTVEDVKGFLDSFTFTEKNEWCTNYYNTRIKGSGDIK